MKIISKFIPDELKDRGYCFAPTNLVEEQRKVRFMYRETPDDDNDSGWRFFAGDESDEYVNDPNNIGLFDVFTIAKIDRDIIPFLDSPFGSAFERETADKPFEPCPFDFGE